MLLSSTRPPVPIRTSDSTHIPIVLAHDIATFVTLLGARPRPSRRARQSSAPRSRMHRPHVPSRCAHSWCFPESAPGCNLRRAATGPYACTPSASGRGTPQKDRTSASREASLRTGLQQPGSSRQRPLRPGAPKKNSMLGFIAANPASKASISTAAPPRSIAKSPPS